MVTDLRMPEMDGFDLIRGVTALPRPPHVVMVTAFGSIETAIRAKLLVPKKGEAAAGEASEA